MTTEFINLELGRVTTLTFNRPEVLNALSSSLLSELQEKLNLIKSNNQVDFLLLRSSSPKAFVAGADIKEMQAANPMQSRAFIELGQNVMRTIEQLAPVVIACVEGFALGGGCELALACDLILASNKARFGQPEVNLGLIPGFGGTQRLLQRCGIGFTRYLVFSGETILADVAERKGLVDLVFDSETYNEKLKEFVEILTSRGPEAIKSCKKVIREYEYELLDRGLKFEQEEFLNIMKNQQAQEGMQAFLEKRRANFKGSN
jgi:enoyl-CoA hydratase